MLKFILYKTPAKYRDQFDDYYSYTNLRQVKIISSCVFAVSLLIRLSSLFLEKEVVKFEFYQGISLANFVQLLGSLSFYILSSYLLNSRVATKKIRKNTSFIFVLYTLTISFSVSYTLTLTDTKNMLLIFLLGIFIVSLFFALEYKSIIAVVLYITVVYFLSLYFSNLQTHQKLINYAAAVILGLSLLVFSRYGYYFKSRHFVKIKQLEEKNQEILRLNMQKGEILAFVAHDLRAPLNNIEALSSLMLLENAGNKEAKIIVDASLQAKNIIDDLIEAAKQDSPVLLKEKLLLNKFIETLVTKWRANANREIRLNVDQKELIIYANSSKLERAIDNLISNAIKFSAADKPLDINIFSANDTINIQIVDYGIGIPKQLLAHVFTQFSVAGRLGLNGEKSIGLGLHISRKIIEQHGGTLSLNSVENEGTTFDITLPQGAA